MIAEAKRWDVFISHASEDKDALVRPLADMLRSFGVSVWYDEFTLHVGDSISRSIDKGVAESRFGVVVVSPTFLLKPWAEYELRGLIAREICEGFRILPVWSKVTKDQVVRYSPTLADTLAIDTAVTSLEDVAIKLLYVIRPDLYAAKPRSEFEGVLEAHRVEMLALRAQLEATEDELSETEDQLEDSRYRLSVTHQELSRYLCPHCGARSMTELRLPIAEGNAGYAILESYACGYETVDGFMDRPCPKDPEFPKFEDYELKIRKNRKGGLLQWECEPRPKSDMARKVPLKTAFGATQEQAVQHVRKQYQQERGNL